ncbi:MAG: 30S ribosomal protein S16 [Ignavibacteria bacterium]|nr:30S ribosomal protein S16 [Ignavibacteria bacterium]
MAVKLRLRRMGKKKQPIYKIVAADSRSPRDGKYLESIGLYNPKQDPYTLEINEDRALYWLNVGAQPTETVRSLLRQKGITHKKELLKRGLSEEQVQAEMEKWANAKVAVAPAKKKKETAVKSTTEVKGASSEEAAE